MSRYQGLVIFALLFTQPILCVDAKHAESTVANTETETKTATDGAANTTPQDGVLSDEAKAERKKILKDTTQALIDAQMKVLETFPEESDPEARAKAVEAFQKLMDGMTEEERKAAEETFYSDLQSKLKALQEKTVEEMSSIKPSENPSKEKDKKYNAAVARYNFLTSQAKRLTSANKDKTSVAAFFTPKKSLASAVSSSVGQAVTAVLESPAVEQGVKAIRSTAHAAVALAEAAEARVQANKANAHAEQATARADRALASLSETLGKLPLAQQVAKEVEEISQDAKNEATEKLHEGLVQRLLTNPNDVNTLKPTWMSEEEFETELERAKSDTRAIRQQPGKATGNIRFENVNGERRLFAEFTAPNGEKAFRLTSVNDSQFAGYGSDGRALYLPTSEAGKYRIEGDTKGNFRGAFVVGASKNPGGTYTLPKKFESSALQGSSLYLPGSNLEDKKDDYRIGYFGDAKGRFAISENGFVAVRDDYPLLAEAQRIQGAAFDGDARARVETGTIYDDPSGSGGGSGMKGLTPLKVGSSSSYKMVVTGPSTNIPLADYARVFSSQGWPQMTAFSAQGKAQALVTDPKTGERRFQDASTDKPARAICIGCEGDLVGIVPGTNSQARSVAKSGLTPKVNPPTTTAKVPAVPAVPAVPTETATKSRDFGPITNNAIRDGAIYNALGSGSNAKDVARSLFAIGPWANNPSNLSRISSTINGMSEEQADRLVKRFLNAQAGEAYRHCPSCWWGAGRGLSTNN